MADDIIQFSPGAKVTAEETNENNLLLKEWALDNTESQAYIDAKMTQLTNDLNNQIGAINTQISSLNTQISSINSSKISATQSKGSKGYVKFSNGIIIQWGTYAAGKNTFATAFSSYARVTISGDYSWNQRNYVSKVEKSYFEVSSNTSASQTPTKHFIAVGY